MRKPKIKRIPLEEYHAGEGISKSLLDEAHRSLAHYLARLAEPEEPTPAMTIGSAVHALILEGEKAFEPFLSLPEFKQTTKTGVKALASVRGMAEAFKAHPTAPRIIEEGEAELSLYWEDADTGLLLKARPDWLRPDGVVLDLKTTSDAREEDFTWTIYKYRYDVQFAMIADGMAANGLAFDRGLIVAIEKEAPYCLAIYALTDEAIEHGRKLYKEDLQLIKAYQDKKVPWTGYPYEIKPIGLPKSALQKESVCYGG
jgi:exodeoxyribonuclease VIII